jgi:hypothetical protein
VRYVTSLAIALQQIDAITLHMLEPEGRTPNLTVRPFAASSKSKPTIILILFFSFHFPRKIKG